MIPMQVWLLLWNLTAAAQDPRALYNKHCAVCHEASEATRAPAPSSLKVMSPEAVLRSLDAGTMQEQARPLSAEERRTLAVHLAGKPFGQESPAAPKAAMCPEPAPPLSDPLKAPHWNGWGVDLSNTRYQPARMAGLTAEQAPKLKLKWAFGFPGAYIAFSQPAVIAGRLFLGSPIRAVYSLDAKTGCIHWAFETTAPVRSAITIERPSANAPYAAFFGDQRAYVYAVDAATGRMLWKTVVETFPNSRITGAVKVHGGRVYVPVSIVEDGLTVNPKYECCKSRPSVVALDAATGRQIWKTLTIPEEPKPRGRNKIGVQMWGPSGASIWSSPTLDLKKNALYVGTGDNHSHPATRTSDAILALDMNTGRMLWSRQLTEGDTFNISCVRPDQTNCPEPPGPDFDFGSSPILVSLPNGRRALIAPQKSGIVHALDPDHQGEVLWQTRIGQGGALGGAQWGAAADTKNAYVPLSDIKLVPDGSRYQADPAAGGGLFALDLATGKIAWHTPPPPCHTDRRCSPAQSAAASMIPGVVFSGSVDGHLRAYRAGDGKIIWDFDTAREYQTVNGVQARGGSMDGPGPVIAGGIVYVNSGYGSWGGLPGNVLLAFGMD
ncbi:MAG: PQQ-binding-like beta-propeller repeat protein [Acidobacteria bacterium]|nr:PQQ-binding-like beta-propeller repeat protein [Acidobacteriota bacterium]